MPADQHQHIEVIARGLWVCSGRVLLCRNVAHNFLYLPGGHVEFAEPAAEALARELAEECNTPVAVGPLLLATEESFTDVPRPGSSRAPRAHHELNLVFAMAAAGQLPMFHVEHPADPPPIQSVEPDIAFDWIELAALVDTDLRPLSIKAWLIAGGPDQASTTAWIGIPPLPKD